MDRSQLGPRVRPQRDSERCDPIVLPTDDDINALIAKCPNDMLRAIVRTLLWTGLRLEEAAGLQRRQIDDNREAITLEQTKRRKPRSVPMSAQVIGTLQALPVRIGCPYVFWHGEGERYRNLSSRLASIGKKAGVRFRRHDLRHRYAVDYLRDGRRPPSSGSPSASGRTPMERNRHSSRHSDNGSSPVEMPQVC
jgi:integrase/recombinase XerD